jgi:hypothetical protein
VDKQAEQLRLKNEEDVLQAYLDHPISKDIELDNKESQDRFMTVLIDDPITDIQSLINHFEARGHLRGLRQAKALILQSVEEVRQRIKELNDEN